MIRSLLVASSLLWALPAAAQGLDLPRPSPAASVSQQVGTVTVSVEYFSPAKRDRKIFGELVPFGEMWRTGANSGTVLTVDGDITIGGEKLEAGEYMVFTIPDKDSWTVVLNSDLNSRPWTHDADKDVLRFDVEPTKGADRERLTFLFTDTTETTTSLDLVWAGVRCSMAIEVDTLGMVNAGIAAYKDSAAGGLARAAAFQGEGGDTDAALATIEMSLAIDNHWYATWTKANLLRDDGQAKQAYRTLVKANELGAEDDNFFYKDRVDKALEEWPKR